MTLSVLGAGYDKLSGTRAGVHHVSHVVPVRAPVFRLLSARVIAARRIFRAG